MRNPIPFCIFLFTGIFPFLSASEPVLLTATRLGSPGNDRIEGVAFAPDDTILITGTFGESLEAPTLGEPQTESQYKTGFVARLSADGREVLAMLQFAPGICHPTTVVAAPNGQIYLAGYATAGLEPLIGAFEPLIPKATTRQKELTRWAPFVHRHDPQINRNLHDERGVPFVLQLKEDLSEITSGTFLEGWQSVWHVPRPLGEDQWQPVDIALLPEGDVLVSHDGGIISDHGDRRPDYRDFYHVPDYVSRLSPDLQTRRWKKEIFTPPNDPAKVKKHLGWDWPHETLGNTRIHRLRAAPDGSSFTIVGWSPSETSSEPWWSPFCFQFTPDGELRQTLYTPSPMAGSDDRMQTLVSDAAVASVHYDHAGDLLLVVKGDGGNSILRRDPLDFRNSVPNGRWQDNLWGFAGRTLFWGGVVRVDGLTGEFKRGLALNGRDERNRVAPAWPIDIAPLPDGLVAVASRHSTRFPFSENAWSEAEFPPRSPGGSLLILDENLSRRFATSLGDVQPFRVESRGTRVVLVGMARSDEVVTHEPNDRPGHIPGLGQSGYVLVVDLDPETETHD
ncbi:MAG: hypothetical protein LAT83_15740 [Kiritimatiellae bacterium]|nr:hypothetical protein [Kiritimatiellia bacterium]